MLLYSHQNYKADMKLTSIENVIPETNIVIFSPHFDDVLFMLGGYINELKKASLLNTKNFHVVLIFSRSNYLAGSRGLNFDNSLERIKHVTGKRLLEDQECNDALLGRFNYKYELVGENECFTRGKSFANSEMEFPHGMYADFEDEDHSIFSRMKDRVYSWSLMEDTALVFPTAIKEHIDHFIVREAAIEVARLHASVINASFYFQEDKPYGGIASEEELNRLANFIVDNKLNPITYVADPEYVIDLAFTHYISQVEEVYKTGIRARAEFLKTEMNMQQYCDRLYKL